VFLDVVGFTRERSVEAQTEIVATLSQIVRMATRAHAPVARNTVYLPTGDGLCIALVDARTSFDVHLAVALDILARLAAHNTATADPMRQFQVRIGLAENVDNLVIDINGNRNVAGAGINTAQRVMSVGDGGQILASQTVYESLRYRERYLSSFRGLNAVVKHGLNLPVYQFIETGHQGLSTVLPSSFVSPTPQLQRLQAYLIAHAIKNEAFFAAQAPRGKMRSAANVLLFFLAADSEGLATETPSRPWNLQTYRAGQASLEEQFLYYMNLDFPVCFALSQGILQQFGGLAECFRHPGFLCFVSETGKARLRTGFPEIWRAFELEGRAAQQGDEADER
jgi:class 3 adenylate cyclase